MSSFPTNTTSAFTLLIAFTAPFIFASGVASVLARLREARQGSPLKNLQLPIFPLFLLSLRRGTDTTV